MSASPQDMQSLLGGLLGVQQQPQVNSGLLGAGDQATAPYGGLTQLGLSLLANSNSGGHFGQIVGQSALQSQQLQQQRQLQQIQIAQGMMSLGLNAQKQRAIMDMLNGQNRQTGGPTQQNVPAEAAAAIPQSAPPPMLQQAGGGYNPSDPATSAQAQGGLLQAPQASSQQQSQSPQFGASQIDQIPINGVSPDLIRRFDLINGKDPITTNKEIREQQLQIYQQSVKPQIDALDNVIKSDKPTQYVAANPQLMQQWNQIAPTLGIDPRTGFTDSNVRTALNFKRNQIAAPAQLGMEAPIVPEKTTQGALGSIYQTNPLTGKMTQVKGEEPLKDVIDPKTGMPTNVRASQAEGKQPFNQSLFGAANVTDQALQFAADTYRSTGKFPTAFGRSPALQAKVLDKVAADAAASGDSAGAIVARQGALKANGMALDQITKREAAVTSFSTTLDKNLDSLLASAKKVDSTGSPLVNRAYRAYQQGIKGDPAVAEMVTWLNAVEGEYAKLNSGSLGNAAPSVSARGDAKEVINKNFSLGGMEAVAAAMRGEAHNTLSSIGQEKQSLLGQMGSTTPPLTHPGQTQTLNGFTITRIK